MTVRMPSEDTSATPMPTGSGTTAITQNQIAVRARGTVCRIGRKDTGMAGIGQGIGHIVTTRGVPRRVTGITVTPAIEAQPGITTGTRRPMASASFFTATSNGGYGTSLRASAIRTASVTRIAQVARQIPIKETDHEKTDLYGDVDRLRMFSTGCSGKSRIR